MFCPLGLEMMSVSWGWVRMVVARMLIGEGKDEWGELF